MKVSILFFIMFLMTGAALADTNTYEAYFSKITAADAEVLLQAMSVNDLDMVYGSIKRIGELKLTNTRKQIYEWLSQSNPIANQGKEERSQQLRSIFRISIWTISRIGDERDAQELISYIKDIKDRDKDSLRVLIIAALGEIRPSTAAVSALNRLVETTIDEPIAMDLLNSIMKHNKKVSANYLIMMSKRKYFSPSFVKMIEDSANLLLTQGEAMPLETKSTNN